MAHHLINKLAIIIGHCDLVRERAQSARPPDAQSIASIAIVRSVATGMVRELKEHGCDLDAIHRMMMLCDAVAEATRNKDDAEVAITNPRL